MKGRFKMAVLVLQILGDIGGYMAGGFATAMYFESKLAMQHKGGMLSPQQWVRVGEAALRTTRGALIAPTRQVGVEWVLNGAQTTPPPSSSQTQEMLANYHMWKEIYHELVEEDSTSDCLEAAERCRFYSQGLLELGVANFNKWLALWEKRIAELNSLLVVCHHCGGESCSLTEIQDELYCSTCVREGAAPDSYYYELEQLKAGRMEHGLAGYSSLTLAGGEENVFSGAWKPEDRHLLSEMPYHVALIEHEGENVVNGKFLGRWDVTAWVVDVVDPDPKSLDILTDMEMTIFDEEGRQVSSWDIPAEKSELFDKFQQTMAEVLFS